MSGPLALPAFASTQVEWGVVWAIGQAHPVITASSFGPSFPDHYRVYRGLTRNFSDASDVSGSLPGAGYGVGVPFTDTAVSIDGVGYVYWMVGFDAGETHATYANSQASGEFPLITPPAGVLVCHNHVINASAPNITGPAPSDTSFTSFPWTNLPLVSLGIGQCESKITGTYGTFTPGTPFIATGAANIGFLPNPANASWGLQLATALNSNATGGPTYPTSITQGPKASGIPFGSIAGPTVFSMQIVGGALGDATNWGNSPTFAVVNGIGIDAELVYIEQAAVYNSPSTTKLFTQSHVFAVGPPPPAPPPPTVPAWVIALGALAGGVNPYVAADFANSRYWDAVNGSTTVNTQWVHNAAWGSWSGTNIVPGQGIPCRGPDNRPVLAGVVAVGLLGHLPITTLARTNGTGNDGPFYAPQVVDQPSGNSSIYAIASTSGNHLYSGDVVGGNSYTLTGTGAANTANGHNIAMLMNADYSGKASMDGASSVPMTAPGGTITPATIIAIQGGTGVVATDFWLGLVAIWQGDQSAHLPAMSA